MRILRLVVIVITSALIGASAFLAKEARSQQATPLDNYAVFVDKTDLHELARKAITLREAWEITSAYAEEWSDDAGLIYLMSSDARDGDIELYRSTDSGADSLAGWKVRDMPTKSGYKGLHLGLDGKRRAWQATFSSAKAGAELNVEITDGIVTYAAQDGIHIVGRTDIRETPSIDSPEALQQALVLQPDFRMSIGKGVGIHFILQLGENGQPQITVVGSRQVDNKLKPFFVNIDQKTGSAVPVIA